MLINMLRAKIHGAKVTDCNVEYEGSLGIDSRLMDLSGILENEKVLVANLANGARFETYVIREKKASGFITLNGAAARLGHIGDRIIILAFGLMQPGEAKKSAPRVIHLDELNRPKKK